MAEVKCQQNLKSHKNIKNVIIKNLTQYKDPIYAGMELGINEIDDALKVVVQFSDSQYYEGGVGHFYYAPDSAI